MNAIFQQARDLSPQIINWRRELHKFPECGLVLPKTADYIKTQLDNLGITYQTYRNHSGITAVIGNKPGKVVALRADIDGLRVAEQTGLPFSSENENMHACGHDAHAAILLGAAKMLKEREDTMEGQVKLIFQPGEEGPGGAYPMVQDGVLEDPKVDYMLALHVGNVGGNYKNGEIVVSMGNTFAADDQVRIVIKGKGGHGSTPEICIDPVAIAALAINNMQYIISREIKPSAAAVITLASVEAGRGTFNVIPDEAELRGTIRCATLELRSYIFKRIREILTGLGMSMRCEFELEFLDGYPPLINNKSVVQSFLTSARKMFAEDTIHMMEEGLMGGEDAAFFFERVPGCYFFLCNPQAHFEDGVTYFHHNSKFAIDDSVIYKGTALFVQAALDLLQ